MVEALRENCPIHEDYQQLYDKVEIKKAKLNNFDKKEEILVQH